MNLLQKREHTYNKTYHELWGGKPEDFSYVETDKHIFVYFKSKLINKMSKDITAREVEAKQDIKPVEEPISLFTQL